MNTTLKFPPLVQIPLDTQTVIGPVVAPTGTVVLIRLSPTTVNCAVTPLNSTCVAPVTLAPARDTVAPGEPIVGANLVITGPAATVNICVPVDVPLRTGHCDQPRRRTERYSCAGTVESLTTVNVADAPFKDTPVTPLSRDPLSVTFVPIGPDIGVISGNDRHNRTCEAGLDGVYVAGKLTWFLITDNLVEQRAISTLRTAMSENQ